MKTCGTCVHFRPDEDWKREYPKHMVAPGDCEFPLPKSICDPATSQMDGADEVDCPCWDAGPVQPEAVVKHVRETTFGVAPNPANALRDLFKGDPASLEAIGQRLGAASPVKLDEASFDEAARVLERPALRCHVCGAATEKTYTFERTYENKDYQARTMRLTGIGLCDGCVPREQGEVDHG